VRFVVWVVSRAWLCLAQLGSDWEGFVRGFVGVGKERRLGRGGGKVRRERKEEGEKERRREKEEGRQAMSTLNRSFVSHCAGSVRCMCGS